MRLRWRLFSLGAVAVAALMVVGVLANPYVLLVFFTKPLKPATPPLLKDATAGGQLICPPHNSIEESLDRPPRTGSREVEARLAREFPVGSEGRPLAVSLRAQGFSLVQECDNDPTIHGAQFAQEGGGFWGPYPVFADIAW